MKRLLLRNATPLLLGTALLAGAGATVVGASATDSAPRLSPATTVYCPPGEVYNENSGKCQKARP